MDTNVAVVANHNYQDFNRSCIFKCRETLSMIQNGGFRLLLDDENLIIDEYRRNLNPSGEPGLGDYFFLWLWKNQANDQHCRKITVKPHRDRGFEEFPNDPDLDTFDWDDRKFVAVALASHSSPELLNASDTDWWHHRATLQKNGIHVVFVCPDLMDD